jgi:hypothetical protein
MRRRANLKEMEGRVQSALDPNLGPVFSTTNDVIVMSYKTMKQKKKENSP